MRHAARLLLAILAIAGAHHRADAADSRQTMLRWLGHGFFVLATRGGIKVAVDPFDDGATGYILPKQILANVALVTQETKTSGATGRLSGSPDIFRSITATGVNRGSGLNLLGIPTFSDPERGALGGRSVIFIFEADGIRFAFSGILNQRLSPTDLRLARKVDVLVAGFGPRLGPGGLLATAAELRAKVLIPAAYKTALSGDIEAADVSPLADQARHHDSTTLALSAADLPKKTEVWMLALPGPEQRKKEAIDFPGMRED